MKKKKKINFQAQKKNVSKSSRYINQEIKIKKMCENKEIDKQWKKIFVQEENQI